MAKKPADENYTATETRDRFEAALRGARIAGPKHRSAVKIAKKKHRKTKRQKSA